MSVLKRFIQLISITVFLVLLSFLGKLNTEDFSRGKHWAVGHEGTFLEASSSSNPGPDESISGLQASIGFDVSSLTSHFHSGVPKPLGSAYTRVLVIPRLKSDNISWVLDQLPDFDTAIYIANDPSATLHPPKNKGHEVMIYLSYMIHHYNLLPDVIVFMHAHRWTHHNNALLAYDAAEMVRRLNGDYVIKKGYVNMRCQWSPGCPEWLHSGNARGSLEKQEEAVLSKSWNELFPSDPLPTALGQACCAQFALSKERVLSVPLSRLIFYRDWIMRTSLSDYVSGRIWEYSWQFLFTGQSIYCPAEHVCYCGGFGLCFGGPIEFEEFEELRRRKKTLELEMNKLGDGQAQRSNTSAMRQAYLSERIASLEQEMALRSGNALERGINPGKRAEECGLEL